MYNGQRNQEPKCTFYCALWFCILLCMTVFLVGIGITYDSNFYSPAEDASETTQLRAEAYRETSYYLMGFGGGAGAALVVYAGTLGKNFENSYFKICPWVLLALIVLMVVAGFVGGHQHLKDPAINNWQIIALGVSGVTTLTALITFVTVFSSPPRRAATPYFDISTLVDAGLSEEEILAVNVVVRGQAPPPHKHKIMPRGRTRGRSRDRPMPGPPRGQPGREHLRVQPGPKERQAGTDNRTDLVPPAKSRSTTPRSASAPGPDELESSQIRKPARPSSGYTRPSGSRRHRQRIREDPTAAARANREDAQHRIDCLRSCIKKLASALWALENTGRNNAASQSNGRFPRRS